MDADKNIIVYFPTGSIEYVCVTPAPNTVLEGGSVEFQVVVTYELDGIEIGKIGADIGVESGTAVLIDRREVESAEGVAILAGTVDVDYLYSVLQDDETYEGVAYLILTVGYPVDPTTTRVLESEAVLECAYPISVSP